MLGCSELIHLTSLISFIAILFTVSLSLSFHLFTKRNSHNSHRNPFGGLIVVLILNDFIFSGRYAREHMSGYIASHFIHVSF